MPTITAIVPTAIPALAPVVRPLDEESGVGVGVGVGVLDGRVALVGLFGRSKLYLLSVSCVRPSRTNNILVNSV